MALTVGAVVFATMALIGVAGFLLDRNAEQNDRRNY
jgi:hypothetical protein